MLQRPQGDSEPVHFLEISITVGASEDRGAQVTKPYPWPSRRPSCPLLTGQPYRQSSSPSWQPASSHPPRSHLNRRLQHHPLPGPHLLVPLRGKPALLVTVVLICHLGQGC